MKSVLKQEGDVAGGTPAVPEKKGPGGGGAGGGSVTNGNKSSNGYESPRLGRRFVLRVRFLVSYRFLLQTNFESIYDPKSENSFFMPGVFIE